MLILIEDRRSPSDAFNRLKIIARQYGASTAATLNAFLLKGFVAIERRYQAPVPQPGTPQAEPDGPEPTFSQGLLSQRVTTAVAVNNWVVRFEGDVYLRGQNAPLVSELDAIRGSLFAPQPANSAQAANQVQELQQILNQGHPPPAPGPQAGTGAQPAGASGGASATGVAVLAGFGELEVASNDGTHVVIASNSGTVHSSDSGKTYSAMPWGVTFSNGGDPSVAVGASNRFYVDLIGYPPGANGMTNCTNTVTSSIDNGATFSLVAHAVVCTSGSGSTCFPDQEHLAADPVRRQNQSLDQLYNVWRNFDATGPCKTITGGSVPMITCSRDSGATWPTRAIIGAGDFPRVAVGRDGFVYTLISAGTSIEINKFSSCATGLAQQAGFPVQVALYQDVACPVPGLDRCNGQNILSSPTIAPDDTDSNHLTVAYATHTGVGNENVMVQDSHDAGLNWSQPVVLNGGGLAQRFMPAACAANGTVWVTWYDRRSSTATVNSNTEFFVNSAAGATVLTAGAEQNLSNIPDPQCNSGFVCGSLDQTNGTSCSVPVTPGSGRGCPKYGDYNGIGCSGGRVFAAWSSAVAPKGSTAIAPGINIYATSFNSSPVSSSLIPPPIVNAIVH